MSGTVLLALVISLMVGGLAATAFIYHVVVSLRSRSAVGLGWAFTRDQRPGHYWLQLFAATIFALYFVVQAVGGTWLALKLL